MKSAVIEAMMRHKAFTTEEICAETGLPAAEVQSEINRLGYTQEQQKREARIRDASARARDVVVRLSEREKSIIQLIAKGISNKIIAIQLGVDSATIKVHVKNILKQFAVNSIEELLMLNEIYSGNLRSPHFYTSKERLIVQLLQSGADNRRIAQEFGLSTSTVKINVKRKNADKPKAKLLIDMPPIVLDLIENHSHDLYDDSVSSIKDIVTSIETWDKKTLKLLSESAKSGELREWVKNRAVDTSHRYSILEKQNFLGWGDGKAIVPGEERITPPGGQIYVARPDRKESAPEFIERVYGGAGWLTGEFTRADLRKIDPQAAMGLNNWEQHHKQRAALNLPTVKERNDRDVTAPDVQTRAKDGTRLRAALRRRTPHQ